jgi:hypothetical protein
LSNEDHKPGYRKPPRHSQFKKGQSGNPSGRPKGSRNFVTELQDELTSRIPIVENGKRRRISKQKAIAKQLVNKAATGDPKFASLFLNERRRYEEQEVGPASQEVSSHEDMRVMENMIRRIRSADAGPLEPIASKDEAAGDASADGKTEGEE